MRPAGRGLDSLPLSQALTRRVTVTLRDCWRAMSSYMYTKTYKGVLRQECFHLNEDRFFFGGWNSVRRNTSVRPTPASFLGTTWGLIRKQKLCIERQTDRQTHRQTGREIEERKREEGRVRERITGPIRGVRGTLPRGPGL